VQRLRAASPTEVQAALHALDVDPQRVPAASWPPADLRDLHLPGLYSWWVDSDGADALTAGIGLPITSGRIYAGQTGATKWPSGRVGKATLRSRIRSQHLSGSVTGSTFRRTLAAALAPALGLALAAPGRLERASEHELSGWMARHLFVAVHPFANRDALAMLERAVLARLDPPLNLDGMPPTPGRARLSLLRDALTRGAARMLDAPRANS
jgi:hypothetical protein